MIGYIFRRIVYGFFILLGVNALTFALFFAVNTPDDMARLSIGGRYVTQQAIDSWKKERGYDVPLIFNSAAEGTGTSGSRTPAAVSIPKLRKGRPRLWRLPSRPFCWVYLYR